MWTGVVGRRRNASVRVGIVALAQPGAPMQAVTWRRGSFGLVMRMGGMAGVMWAGDAAEEDGCARG